MTTVPLTDPSGIVSGRTYRWLWAVPPASLLAAIALSFLAAPHLPERMPTHWGFEGRPTNLLPRWLALSALPAVMAWAGFLTAVIGWSAGQTREGRDMPAWISPAVTALVCAILLLLHAAMIGFGLGWGISIPLITNLAVGVLYIALGLAMPRVPPNPVFGVRTAATLACPDAWERANRVGGRWLVGAGVATAGAAPLPGGWPMAVLLGSVIVACIASIIASRDVGTGGSPTGWSAA